MSKNSNFVTIFSLNLKYESRYTINKKFKVLEKALECIFKITLTHKLPLKPEYDEKELEKYQNIPYF